MVSKATIWPSLNCNAARFMVEATCSHPCAGGDKGLLRVTSSLWENRSFIGSEFPFRNSPCARLNRSISSSSSSPVSICRDHLRRGHPALSLNRHNAIQRRSVHGEEPLFTRVRGRDILRSSQR